MTINILPVNDPPILVDDDLDVRVEGSFRVLLSDLLGNDSVGPANEAGQTLQVTAVDAVTAEGAALTLESDAVLVPCCVAGVPLLLVDPGGASMPKAISAVPSWKPLVRTTRPGISSPSTLGSGSKVSMRPRISNFGKMICAESMVMMS